MNLTTSFSHIDPDVVARIEPRLDQTDICSCIFLLFDNVDTALQHICQEIQSSRRYRPVLDSALFRAGESYHDGALARWARSCVKTEPHWQDKLLEALLIIKNYSIIRALGKRKEDLDLKYLPLQLNSSCHVDLVRKTLYLMIEDLNKQEWDQLQQILVNEAIKQNISVLPMYGSVPECLILFLMSRGLLKIKQEDVKMDFQLLRSCLKGMDLYSWSQHIEAIENLINRNNVLQTDHEKEYNTTVLPRFNLDPQNPGTILIFNLVQYEDKAMGSGKPLTKRMGSDLDCEKLRDTFCLLGFSVLPPVHDPTSEEITKTINLSLKEFCKKTKEERKKRCFVVSILAHGDKDGVFGTDGKLVTWESIRAELRSSDTQGLPRLLLVQACKGISRVTKASEKLEVVEDGPSSNAGSAGNLRDLFEFSASVSGFAAYRHTKYGSFFIHSFCKQILLFGRDLSLHLISPLINKDFEDQHLSYQGQSVYMTSELNTTSSKTLYLGVPESKDSEAKALVWKWEEEKMGDKPPLCSSSKGKDKSPAVQDRKPLRNLRANQPKNPELTEQLKALALALANS